MLRRPTLSTSRFGRFQRRLVFWAFGTMLLLCIIGPALDVCIDAKGYRHHNEAGDNLARLATEAAGRTRSLLARGANKSTLDLQLAVWRTELLASQQLDRHRDSTPMPSLWREVQIGVLQLDGSVLATSGKLTLDQREEALVKSQLSGAAWQREPGEWLVAAAPVHDGGARRLLLRLYVPTDATHLYQAGVRYLMLDLVQTAVLSLLIAWVASWVSTRPMIRSLETLNETVDVWASGDFSARARMRKHDDLGVLTSRLNSMAEQLEQLIALRTQMAAAGERERLLSELHDSVKQRMFALSMQLAAARAQNAGKYPDVSLQTAQELTAQMQRDLHRLIQPIQDSQVGGRNPSEIQEDLYALAAQWRREEFDIIIQVELSAVIPLATWKCLTGICSEALANAARHSGAAQVKIELASLPDGRLRLLIQDNGWGFLQSKVQLGRGLNSMEQRAQALTAGVFALDSAPGKGCQITVECHIVVSI